jgi:hypothetical protein
MSHYTKSYADLSREQADAGAIADMREYLNDKQWEALLELAKAGNVRHVNMALGLAGVSGRPFHAFCRAHMLEAYRAWMADGDDAVQTDEAGFSLEVVS